MALTIYATHGDLVAYGTTVPDGGETRYLQAATFAVAEAANRNPYGDVPTGDDATALKDATVAQVAGWVALGIDPDRQGADAPRAVKRSKILTGDLEYDTSAQADAIKSLAEGELVPQAEAILQAAGLLWVPVPRGDECGALPSWGTSGSRFGTFDPTFANSADAWPWL